MEGQFYLMGIAGLSLSLAGFSALITVFRKSWDPVTLWRVKAIVRYSLDGAALVPVPVFYLTSSDDWAIRAGTGLMLLLNVITTIRSSPMRDAQAWPEGFSRVPFYFISAVTGALIVFNLFTASLGLFLLILVWALGLPASIFAAIVEEFRPSRGDE